MMQREAESVLAHVLAKLEIPTSEPPSFKVEFDNADTVYRISTPAGPINIPIEERYLTEDGLAVAIERELRAAGFGRARPVTSN